MSVVWKRILTALGSLLLLCYVIYQAYAALYHPIKTIRAQLATSEDTISSQAFILHGETVISKKPQGVLDTIRSNGENVAKGGTVAVAYATATDAENRRKIQQIGEQIARYQQMGNATEAASVDVGVLNEEIQKGFMSLSAASDSADAQGVQTAADGLLTLLDEKQLATGELQSFSAQIANLQKQSAQLAAQTGGQTGTVTAPVAGYFVSAADGLENAYPMADALSINAAAVKALLAKKAAPVSGAVGKIITSYQSYIVCPVDSNDAYRLKVGSSVTLDFQQTGVNALPATVAAINRDSSGCAVVFSASAMSEAFATLRRQDVTIVVGTYTGVKVADSLLHIVNGRHGVFVRDGNVVEFKQVDQIFSAQGYILSAQDTSKSGALQLYDDMVINGDGLHDGQVVQ